jgi:energy-coupling factor transport system permease protein
MLDKLLFGRYIQGSSLVHRLDPRAKLIGAFYFIIVIFLANNWQTYLIMTLFTFLCVILSDIKLSVFLNGVKPLIWLILFTVLLQILFTRGGENVLSAGTDQHHLIQGHQWCLHLHAFRSHHLHFDAADAHDDAVVVDRCD